MSNDVRPEVQAALDRQRDLDVFLRDQGLSPQPPLGSTAKPDLKAFRPRPLSVDDTIDSHLEEDEELRQRVLAVLADEPTTAADEADEEAEFETWADRDAAGED